MGRNFSQYALKSFFDIKLVQVKKEKKRWKGRERETAKAGKKKKKRGRVIRKI